MKNLKNGQKYAIKFQQIYSKLSNGGGGYSVLLNYQSFLSKFFH